MNVSAVIVTRGDVDLAPVVESLPFDEVVVWDNSGREDLAVYGRYEAISETGGDLVYVQDDDCIVEDPAGLVAAWEGLRRPAALVMNLPDRFRRHYPDSGLVGFGAVFHRDAPERAFEEFARRHFPPMAAQRSWGRYLLDRHPTFRRTCDVVFAALTPRVQLDLKYRDREFASDANRMWKQDAHYAERGAMLIEARAARG